MVDRASWLAEMRRRSAAEEHMLAPTYDERWGVIDDLHRAFVDRFLARLPAEPRVLDAACGTGTYFGMVIERGGAVVGVDHSEQALLIARNEHPGVEVHRYDLHELPFREAFDGVMCVDAMEFVPPEGWPVVLERFRMALHRDGALYLTVELHTEADLRRANEAARLAGYPALEGEVLWHDESGAYYHHHPSLERVRSWIDEAGFEIEDEREGPWDPGYAYHHLLCGVT